VILKALLVMLLAHFATFYGRGSDILYLYSKRITGCMHWEGA
jgi:hypothetical protein